MQKKQSIYFRQQSSFSLQCGVFSVNHLLGGRIYTTDDFNNICYSLSQDFINPHKHVFGGDFDVNVLMLALEKQGLQTTWFDERKGPLSVPRAGESPKVAGYLVNIFSQGAPSIIHRLCRISKRHWLAVRRVDGKYFWLDSKMNSYRQLSSEMVEQQLNKLLASPGEAEEKTVVLVVNHKQPQ